MKLTIRYVMFAVIATMANIGAQDIVIRGYSGTFDIAFSVAVGTVVGLVVKYMLDKRYIFCFQTRNTAHDIQTFSLYALMGLAMTAIFWGFEFGFHYAFHSKESRYLGGVIGLAIGYAIKYQLDKRYVFRKDSA